VDGGERIRWVGEQQQTDVLGAMKVELERGRPSIQKLLMVSDPTGTSCQNMNTEPGT